MAPARAPKPHADSPDPTAADAEDRILRAAHAVFVRRGTAGARMHEIAAEAGVNQALIHYYFRTKDALAERVFRDTAARMLPVLAQLQRDDHTIESLVTTFVTGYIDVVRDAPFIPGYLLAEAQHHPERLHALIRGAIGSGAMPFAPHPLVRVEAILAPAIANGTIRPIEPLQFVVNVMALTVFPFVAAPILSTLLGLHGDARTHFLDERRATLPSFILNALRP